jgi:hypothetical protein
MSSTEHQEQEERKPIVLANGTLKDPVTGHFMSGPDKEHQFIPRGDTAAAMRMNQHRRELAARKARAAITRAAQEGGFDARGPTDAYAAMAGEFAKSALANAIDKPRDAVPAAKLSLRLADMLPAEAKDMPAEGARLELSQAALEFLAGMVKHG